MARFVGPLFYLNSAILYAVNFTLYNRRVHKRERDCMTEEFDQLRRSRARAYLEHVRAERIKVDTLRDELSFERESMEPKGIRFDKLGGCSSAYADAIPDGVSRLEAMAERYSERERGYIEASARAREAISAARSAKGASVLMRRYLLDEPWCEVAADVGCSSRTAMRLHDEALLDVYEAMPHEWRIPRHPAV